MSRRRHSAGNWREDLARIREDHKASWPDVDKSLEAARFANMDWEGRARMARARQSAGLDLDERDTEALRRYPA